MPKEADEKENTIVDLGAQHRLFVLEECDLTHKFKLRLWYRAQVEAGQVWQVYRNGVQHFEPLKAGPHVLWNALWNEWKALRINLRIVHLTFDFKGRVRGPSLSRDAQSSAGVDLGCNVTARLELTCKISNIETFLQYEQPINVFNASLKNMIVERIGKLGYDQFGDWATTLRDEIRRRIQGGTDDTERLIGVRVEEIYVTEVKPDTLQDRSMMAMYQQVERVRRELTEAQANRQRDTENARSFAEQGDILNIAPSILALQNSPIGKELLTRDADIRKLMVAAGLVPGTSVQPINDPVGQFNAGTPSVGYLNPPRSASTGTTGPITFQSGPLQGGGSASGSMSPPPTSGPLPAAQPPVTPERQDEELTALQSAGFQCGGRGQFSPTYNSQGQPIPGTMEWTLEVFIQRIRGGYITIGFTVPPGYPNMPPRVQVRLPSGGGMKAIVPNVVRTWNSGNKLVDIVHEIDNNTP